MKFFTNQKGVTIIELSVVIAVFVIIISIVFNIFLLAVQRQKDILVNQEYLGQLNYVTENLSRNIRTALLDQNGSCAGSGYYYLLNNYDANTGFYQGIKFISKDGDCEEFFLDENGILKEIKNGGVAQNILSDSFEVKYARFVINGDRNLEGASSISSIRPRITFSLNVEIKKTSGVQEKVFQRTISRTSLQDNIVVEDPPLCLLAGTKIRAIDNSLVEIQDIKIGDEILGFDEENSTIKLVRVNKIFEHKNFSGYYLINLNDGSELKITGNHPVYIGNNSYKIVKDLREGDFVYTVSNKMVKIIKIEFINKSSLVYNLEVHDTHNYFANNVLVHNKSEVECISHDGFCENPGENCSSCPEDCGICFPPPPPPLTWCITDEFCDSPGEDCSSCPGDCGTCLPSP